MKTYQRRILLAGLAILTLSFLSGIALSFYQWDLGSPFAPSSWGQFNPLGRATYAPLIFALMLFPVSLPIVLILSVLVYAGMQKEKLWPLSLFGFLSMGAMWLWYLTELWSMD